MNVDALLRVFARRFNIYEPGDCLRVAVARRAKQSNQTRQLRQNHSKDGDQPMAPIYFFRSNASPTHLIHSIWEDASNSRT
jgi:hypothetical protein